MDKTIRLLAVLLGVQLLLAFGLSMGRAELAPQISDAPLFMVDTNKVDKLTLEGPGDAKVVIAKTDGIWRLPGSGDFPADKSKIGQFLEQVKGLRQGQAVAQTEGAQKRFKVSDAEFERRIVLSSGDQPLATLYLGTSPAMRQVHARADGQDTIYAINFTSYGVSLKAEDWIDKTILQIPEAQIEGMDVAGLAIKRADSTGEAAEVWQAATGLGEGESLNPEAAENFARALADLQIAVVLGTVDKPEFGLKTPLLSTTLHLKDGSAREYRVGKVVNKDEYILKVSTRPEYFLLAAYMAKPLLDAAKREVLLAPQKDETSASAAEIQDAN